ELQGKAEEQRPHQIELLLDRQGPEVLEHRLTPEAREVRLLMEDEVPVRHVSEGRDDSASELRRFVREEQDDVRARDGDHRDQSREQTARTMEVEAPEPESPAVPSPHVEEHRRDQVTAQHEEHVDAEETAAEPSEFAVVKEHGGDREGAHAVQRRDVAQPRARVSAPLPVVKPSCFACSGASTRAAVRGSSGCRRGAEGAGAPPSGLGARQTMRWAMNEVAKRYRRAPAEARTSASTGPRRPAHVRFRASLMKP